MSRIFSAINKFLPQNTFARGVSVLVGGTASAQILLVLASPLLTRIYTPENFGLLAVYAGVLSILTVFGCLRYEIAIPLPKTDLATYNVIALCFIVLTLLTGVISLIIFLFSHEIVSVFRIESLVNYVWFVPVGMFLSGLYSIFNYWAIRKKRFKDMTLTKLYQSVVILFIQVAFYKFGSGALILGHAVGKGAGSLRLARTIDAKKFKKSISFKKLKILAVRYKNFPLFSTWTGVFNAVGNQLPPIIFAAVFSSGIAGFYALAHRVASLPASVIGQAVSNVFLSSAPDAHMNGWLDQLLFRVVLALSLIAFPAGMFLIINAEFIFSIIFGENWQVAGLYASILVPMLLMGFVTSPVTTLCAVLGKQFAGTIFQFSMMTLRIVSISVGVYVGDALLALELFSVTSALCYLAFLLWLTSASNGSIVKMLGMLTRCVLTSFLILVMTLLVRFFGISFNGANLTVLIYSIFGMLAVYFLNYKVWSWYAKA